ncbi:hypothetical protein RJP21_16680 [Paenibacillus sp. VCA1]|uniref:hypothetical protein n=1 Tax=Paenibacillus sp. VCA1 TaxID=3039148 RepID=UPI0028718A39|nr:hypothetical protein [Paenibacillus sp. VCA1]MDR9855253.1 hypothetical protein [Paenibacillus sp. VCA1]
MVTALTTILLFLLIPTIILVTFVKFAFKNDKKKTNYVLSGITVTAIILALINSLITNSFNQSNITVFLLLIITVIISFRVNSKKRNNN